MNDDFYFELLEEQHEHDVIMGTEGDTQHEQQTADADHVEAGDRPGTGAQINT